MRNIALALVMLAVGCGDHSPEAAPQWCERTAEETACLEKHWIMTQLDGAMACLPRLGVADGPTACEGRGGEPLIMDDGAYWGCHENTTDAGCPCRDGSECFGYCEAPEGAPEGSEVIGACSRRTAEECFFTVRDGKVMGLLCI